MMKAETSPSMVIGSAWDARRVGAFGIEVTKSGADLRA